MAEQGDTNERTEQPTERRKEESRKKGQVPRSKELNTMLSLLLAGAGPFFLVMIIGAFVGPLVMGGWSFSWQAMAFKLEKVSPLSGMKRIFSAKSLAELLKALVKFLLLISATVMLFRAQIDDLLALGSLTPIAAFQAAASLLIWCLVLLACVMLLIVAVDVPFELWNHNRQLKMTRQEVRDEMKETEGRPEVKGRIRQLQRESSQRRMMEDVPNADVVITNPTHYAVALQYSESSGGAPKVVAKGKNLIAANIRGIAAQHDIVLFEAPPLARALYRNTEIGDEIPQNLYIAVARVLAYVFQLRNSLDKSRVMPPEQFDIPAEYLAQDGAEGFDS
ncbi:MAG: flagellar biosynthetic protein FlhB [Gammaproteobacteria bacterium]|nr:MAG: flagellar biosynthetic protein FlhB [Gammaproteobacteria bacterium]